MAGKVALTFALALCLATSVSADAQAVDVLRLKAADARVAEEFTNLTSLRELPDGRVLVTDRRDGRLALIDLASGSVRSLGRKGSGPNEYGDLGPVIGLGSDSSLVVDVGNLRWLLMKGDSIVATLPPETPAIQSVTFWVPFGIDRAGNLLSMQFRPRDGRGQHVTDSVNLTRVSRSNGRIEVIGALRYGVPTRGTNVVTKGSEGEMRYSRPPYNIREEQPLLFADGWIAVARYEPYRVDWRSPDGQWVRGAPLPGRAVPMTAREREAYLRRRRLASSQAEWPVNVPPFDKTFPLLASPEGLLVIPRVPSADHPAPRCDFVDRRGVLRGQLVLANEARLLAFGAKSAYVVITDSDGIERLQRHPWP